MSDVKWKWIVQNKNWSICRYGKKPLIDNNRCVWVPCGNDNHVEWLYVQTSRITHTLDNWKESLINLETHDFKIVDGILVRVGRQAKETKHSHYKKDVKHLDYIDVYRIIDLYELNDPCFQHALKKILVPGARGHKDLTKDINDIIDTMQRKLEMLAENEKKL